MGQRDYGKGTRLGQLRGVEESTVARIEDESVKLSLREESGANSTFLKQFDWSNSVLNIWNCRSTLLCQYEELFSKSQGDGQVSPRIVPLLVLRDQSGSYFGDSHIA